MKNLKSRNILFVEDNITFRKSASEFMEMFFQSVYSCATAKEALKLYKTKAIHLIICDIKLKGSNGLDLIKQIRKIDKNIPIVVISAHKEEDFLFKAIELNLITYKLKPLSFEDYMEIFQAANEKINEVFCNITHIDTDISYDSDQKLLIVDQHPIQLNKKEVLFIELLIANMGKLVSKEMVQSQVWKGKAMSDAALKNFTLRFRKKIGVDLYTIVSSLGFQI
jgi:DNA-binding response OmpR family regulator